MELSPFTEKYLEIVSSLATVREVLVDNANVQRETLEKIKEKGQTLSSYNNKTSEYVKFYEDLKFVEEGVNGSWKDNLSSEYSQEYYSTLQERIEQILKDKS